MQSLSGPGQDLSAHYSQLVAALPPEVQDYSNAHNEVVRVAGLFYTFIAAANVNPPVIADLVAAAEIYGLNAYYIYNTWNSLAGKVFKTNLSDLFRAEFVSEVLKAHEAAVALLP